MKNAQLRSARSSSRCSSRNGCASAAISIRVAACRSMCSGRRDGFRLASGRPTKAWPPIARADNAFSVATSAPTSTRRIGGAHDAAHHRDAGAARGHDFADPRGIDAADGEDWHAARAGHFAETFAADFGAVARLARRLEGGSGERIVGGLRIDRLGFGDGVDRHADELSRTHQRAGCGGIAAGWQMHAIDAGDFRQCRLAVQHQPRAMFARYRDSVRAKTTCSSSGKSFSRRLIQRQPPPSAAATISGSERRAWVRSVTNSSVGSGSRIVVLCLAPCRPTAIMGNLCAEMNCLRNGGYAVARRSTARIVLAGALILALGWASPSPVWQQSTKSPPAPARNRAAVAWPIAINFIGAKSIPASAANRRRCRSGVALNRAASASPRIAERLRSGITVLLARSS